MLKAWKEIDRNIKVKAFKNSCISNALDESEDDILFEDESEGESEDQDPFADISLVEEINYSDI